eukprot:GHVR01165599.1.p1 GENE.GHVR01165599.1~~GHVR01165599.1.p1  ORF type:complete len:694 (-),score=50.15 GHVR01165599.1:138-2105(-)
MDDYTHKSVGDKRLFTALTAPFYDFMDNTDNNEISKLKVSVKCGPSEKFRISAKNHEEWWQKVAYRCKGGDYIDLREAINYVNPGTLSNLSLIGDTTFSNTVATYLNNVDSNSVSHLTETSRAHDSLKDTRDIEVLRLEIKAYPERSEVRAYYTDPSPIRNLCGRAIVNIVTSPRPLSAIGPRVDLIVAPRRGKNILEGRIPADQNSFLTVIKWDISSFTASLSLSWATLFSVYLRLMRTDQRRMRQTRYGRVGTALVSYDIATAIEYYLLHATFLKVRYGNYVQVPAGGCLGIAGNISISVFALSIWLDYVVRQLSYLIGEDIEIVKTRVGGDDAAVIIKSNSVFANETFVRMLKEKLCQDIGLVRDFEVVTISSESGKVETVIFCQKLLVIHTKYDPNVGRIFVYTSVYRPPMFSECLFSDDKMRDFDEGSSDEEDLSRDVAGHDRTLEPISRVTSSKSTKRRLLAKKKLLRLRAWGGFILTLGNMERHFDKREFHSLYRKLYLLENIKGSSIQLNTGFEMKYFISPQTVLAVGNSLVSSEAYEILGTTFIRGAPFVLTREQLIPFALKRERITTLATGTRGLIFVSYKEERGRQPYFPLVVKEPCDLVIHAIKERIDVLRCEVLRIEDMYSGKMQKHTCGDLMLELGWMEIE